MANTFDSIKNQNVIWYYQSEENPWLNASTNDSHDTQWATYRDLEIDLIEEAYQNNESYVVLDLYKIDFKHFIQINLNDQTKQRPVKREKISDCKQCLRANRFSSIFPMKPSSPCDNFDSWCPFLTDWLNSSSGRKATLQFHRCIEICAQGIIREAILHDSNSIMEATYMAEKLRQYSEKSRHEIAELCINFYTKDSFLYYALNKALRENDSSKLDTLGPLCYIIWNYSRRAKAYVGTVYRGVQLTYNEIEIYKKHVGEWRTWPAYTSTSKNQRLAEIFGNTLFIIEIIDVTLSMPRGHDISSISSYSHEEEVLIPAGVSFQILKVELDCSQKNIIYLKV